MTFYEILVAQDATASRREAQENNSARLAFSMHKMKSSGTGTVRVAEPITFDVVFLEEPLFTQGATLVERPADALDPVGSAGVWQWQRNPKGHYTGAFVYLDVRVGEVEIGSGGTTRMIHHLLFQGTGYKDLGQAVATEAQALTPRTVGFGV